MLVYINGNYYEETNANISVLDKAFMRGGCLLRIIRTYNQIPFLLDESVDLLFQDVMDLGHHLPWTRDEVSLIVKNTIQKNRYSDSKVSIIVSLFGPKLIVLSERLNLTNKNYEDHFEIKSDIVKKFTQGEDKLTEKEEKVQDSDKSQNNDLIKFKDNALCLSEIHRPYSFQPLQELFLDNIYLEKRKKGFIDIMLTKGNIITDCAYHELFFIKNEKVLCSAISLRRPIKKFMSELIEIKELELNKKDIFNIDECFIASAVDGIIPIKKLGNVIIPKHDLTLKIKSKWDNYVSS